MKNAGRGRGKARRGEDHVFRPWVGRDLAYRRGTAHGKCVIIKQCLRSGSLLGMRGEKEATRAQLRGEEQVAWAVAWAPNLSDLLTSQNLISTGIFGSGFYKATLASVVEV